MFGQLFDIRDLVRRVSVKKAFQPDLAQGSVGWCRGDDASEDGDGIVNRSTDSAGRTVHLFQRGREFFKKQNGTLGGEHDIFAGRLFDLGNRYLHPLDRWL